MAPIKCPLSAQRGFIVLIQRCRFTYDEEGEKCRVRRESKRRIARCELAVRNVLAVVSFLLLLFFPCLGFFWRVPRRYRNIGYWDCSARRWWSSKGELPGGACEFWTSYTARYEEAAQLPADVTLGEQVARGSLLVSFGLCLAVAVDGGLCSCITSNFYEEFRNVRVCVSPSVHDWNSSNKVFEVGVSPTYPSITYYWTVPLILDQSYLVGEINKFENCWYKSVRILEVLKLLFPQFLNLSSSQRDMSGPRFGDLSNDRWSGGTGSFSQGISYPLECVLGILTWNNITLLIVRCNDSTYHRIKVWRQKKR
jgi:hypothetical protein